MQVAANRTLGTQRPDSTWTRGSVAALVLSGYALFVAIIAGFDHYAARIEGTGDNSSYSAATAILLGLPHSAVGAMHFLGYPLLAAGVSSGLQLDAVYALAVVSGLASLAAIAIAAELWGGWAAACFALANVDWIQRSLLGGADPVFAAFIFASLWSARRERWLLAAVLGALATVVRPLGVIALLALGLVLLSRRQLKTLLAAVAISVIVGAAYLWLVRTLYGNPLGNFTWYSSMGLGHDRNFIPFVTVFLHAPGHPLTLKNMIKTLFWTVFTAAAITAASTRPSQRAAMRGAPVEWLFGALYFGSFFFFPGWWIDGEYPRYFAPVIPLCFFALQGWLPQQRGLIWAAGLASIVVAALEDTPAFNHALAAWF